MKDLPQKTSNEVWIKPNYLILRFMKSKKAYKTSENQPVIFTVKRIENGEVQLHIRFDGRDEWFSDTDTLDIDVYIPTKEFEKMTDKKPKEASLVG